MLSLSGQDLQNALCGTVALGWQVAHLNNVLCFPARSVSTSEAPQDGKLLGGRRSLESNLPLWTMQVKVSVANLKEVFAASGTVPATGPLDTVTSSSDGTSVQILLHLHEDVLMRLSAVDFRFGKAYNIGRIVANLPFYGGSPEDVLALLDHLMLNVQDLRSALPPHVAKTVVDSIDNWKDWLSTPLDAEGQALGRLRAHNLGK